MNLTTMHRNERGDLVFKLTREGRAEMRQQEPERGDEANFLDLIEHHLCNGLGLLRPEEVGALTSSLILTDGHHDDHGEYEGDGDVWWFERYQVDSYTETLASKDGITFERAAK